MQSREDEKFNRGFRYKECVKCGECLANCQYLQFSSEQARLVMEKIIAAPEWYEALTPCIRCGKCNHRCPKDARPGDLMSECLAYRRKESNTVPPSMAYGINGMGPEGWGENFFKDVYKGLGNRDKSVLRAWATPKNSKDLLFVGCTDRMMPRNLENARVFKDIAKFGGPDDCCGIWAIQGGLIEEGFRISKRLVNRLSECRFERLVVACGHCQKVLTKVMPEKLGITLPFQIISIYDYLLERVERGAANIENPLTVDAAISDPCFAYENGEKYLNSIRILAETIGMRISEMPNNREASLCCGYGGLFTNGKIADVVKASLIKRKDLAGSGKKHIVSYCPGCHLVNHYFQPGYKSHYLLEKVLYSFGDRLETPYSIFYRRLFRPHIAWNLARISKSALG